MTRDEQIMSLRRVVFSQANAVLASYADLDLDDLISDGWVGAIQAVDRYDAQNAAGASLSTFAKYRIRGAILDGLRARDYVPVSEHRKATAGSMALPAQPLALDREIDHDLRLVDTLIDAASTAAVDHLLEMLDVSAEIDLLPPRQAYVIRECFLAGRSQADIALGMRLTPGRVSQLVKEAKSHLANGLSMANS